jgi:actin-related protein 10
MRVPLEVLTDAVIDEIKSRCCFVSEALEDSAYGVSTISADNPFEMEPPLSDSTRSESEFSHLSVGADSNTSSQQGSSEFSVVSNVRASPADRVMGEGHLQALATMYSRHSTATDLHMSVVPPLSQQTGTGRGTLIIPGWIRERAAEVLFEGGDVDESSIAEVILDALLKVRLPSPSNPSFYSPGPAGPR